MPKPRHEPVRTCVACREEGAKGALVRLVRGPDGAACVDLNSGMPGRGAYLHRDAKCVELARKRRQLERSLAATISPELWTELSS